MHITASLSDVVAMGTAPPRLEIELQTIQFFPISRGSCDALQYTSSLKHRVSSMLLFPLSFDSR
jgi:hypothetical protein